MDCVSPQHVLEEGLSGPAMEFKDASDFLPVQVPAMSVPALQMLL